MLHLFVARTHSLTPFLCPRNSHMCVCVCSVEARAQWQSLSDTLDELKSSEKCAHREEKLYAASNYKEQPMSVALNKATPFAKNDERKYIDEAFSWCAALLSHAQTTG